MKFIDKISGLFRRSQKQATVAVFREGGSWRDLIDIPLTPALSVSTVYRCVELLSNSVAVLPFRYSRLKDGVFVEDPSNSLAYLLDVQPDPSMSAFDFKRQIVIELLLAGNAYIIPYYSAEGDGYYRLALCSRNTVSYDSCVNAYTVSDSENGIFGTFSEDEVIHIKGLPGASPKRGLSVLTHARETVDVAAAGSRETLKRFQNGGDVRGIVSNTKGVQGFGEYQDKELQRMAEDIDHRMRDLGERVVAMYGQVEWTPLSMTSADMQFLEMRKFTVREICRFFGVHPSFVFDDTSNNYKSAEMANVAFLSNTLNPLLVKIENEFTRKLFSRKLALKRRVSFDRRQLYACDLQSRVLYESKLLGLGYTVNEVRKMNDLPGVEGGDTPLVSANLKGLTQLLSEQTPDPTAKTPEEENEKH